MADEQDAERTFQPTPKRLEQAREKGQIPRSRELATAAVALSGAVALWWVGPELYRRCLGVFRSGLAFDREAAVDPDRMLAGLSVLSLDMLIAIAPLLGLVLVATLGAPMLLSGWMWSTTAMTPDFSRLNPARGLGNMFSKQSLVELAKAIAKCVLLGGIGYWAVASSWSELAQLPARETGGAVARVGILVSHGFFALVGGLVVVALVDVPWQIWHYHDELKMTRQEVVEEQRELEGDPQLKARIRSQQREIARRRMMSEVPKADVVVTNPTHYAVALQYATARCARRRWSPRAMNLHRRSASANSPPSTTCRCSRRRRWRAPCIATPSSATKSRRRSTRRSPRCWPTSTSSTRHRAKGGRGTGAARGPRGAARARPAAETPLALRKAPHDDAPPPRPTRLRRRAMSALALRLGLNRTTVVGLAGPILIVLILAMMVLPLPPFLLDLLFTFNIALAMIVLLVGAVHA